MMAHKGYLITTEIKLSKYEYDKVRAYSSYHGGRNVADFCTSIIKVFIEKCIHSDSYKPIIHKGYVRFPNESDYHARKVCGALRLNPDKYKYLQFE